VHPPEIIRRRFSGDWFNLVGNPPCRLMTRLAKPAKRKVVAPVAKIMAGWFGLHKRRDTLPTISKRRFYSESECSARPPGDTAPVSPGFTFQDKK
jgi:hypothetical protein